MEQTVSFKRPIKLVSIRAFAVVFFSCITVIALTLTGCERQHLEHPAHFKASNGQTIHFPSKEGHFIVLNFWASWCTPCLAEIPDLNELNLNPELDVVGYNTDNLTPESLQASIKKLNIKYPNLLEDPRDDLDLPGLQGIPTTYILTPEGEWLDPLVGAQSAEKILKKIHQSRKT